MIHDYSYHVDVLDHFRLINLLNEQMEDIYCILRRM